MRLFPPLRAAWSPRGEQAHVSISGRNSKRVIFVALNLATGHRIAISRSRSGIAEFVEFLRLLRRRYRHRPIALILDQASWHTNRRVVKLAEELSIVLLWLPARSPELNPVDHLFGPMKDVIAANRQIEPLDEHVRIAIDWLMSLTHTQALRKAGLKAPDFWLTHLSKNFCPST